MTRWLQAARQESEVGTKLTKPTEPQMDPVLLVLSVLSEGQEIVEVQYERCFPGGVSRLNQEYAITTLSRRLQRQFITQGVCRRLARQGEAHYGRGQLSGNYHLRTANRNHSLVSLSGNSICTIMKVVH